MAKEHNQKKIVEWFLRIGLAFSFAYAAIGGFTTPSNWIGYFPSFLSDYLPEAALLVSWGIVECVIALWLLLGKRLFIPSLVAAISLLGVVLFNWGARDIIFRDVSIVCMALALAVMYSPRKIRYT